MRRAKGHGTQMNAYESQMNAGPPDMRRACPKLFASILITVSSLAHAEVTVKDAWVRGTVPAQTTTGAFMTLTSTTDAKLVGAASAVAKMVEIHESMMHGTTAHMQEVKAIPLPAGKPVELKPGAHHVMLMGLSRPLKAGDTVPLTLTIEEKGKRSTVEVKAAVRPLGGS